MISVLMSVYNESLSDIKMAVDSILEQTFADFEFIIVLDNPHYVEAKDYLQKCQENDARIKLIFNQENIGLAMSMNKAASIAQGEYLLRMDADDISVPERFTIQIQAIAEGDYDLVCSDYDFIDENGQALNNKTTVYTNKQIEKSLPYRNVIHHPTVIMKTDTFKRLGGYRNYQCAQDYDLWLRMLLENCTFHMINEKLLHYRVRQSSTTIKHRYKQVCTRNYILSLWKKKMQGYSYEGYLEYLNKHKATDATRQQEYEKYALLYSDSKKKIKKGNVFGGFFGIMKVLFCSKYYRPHILRNTGVHFITKFIK